MTTASPKCICYVPTHRASWQEMFEIARMMPRSYGIKQIFIDLGKLEGQYNEVANEGLKVVNLSPNEPNATERILVTAARALHKLRLSTSSQFLKVQARTRQLSKYYRNAQKLLDTLRPSLLVAHSGRTTLEVPLMKICQDNNIPVVVPPIAFPSGGDDIIDRRRGRPEYNAADLEMLNPMLTGQFMYDKLTDKSYTYYDVTTTLALTRISCLPSQPWQLGGGWNAQIMAESQTILQRLLDQGINSKSLSLTGNLTQDELYHLYYQRNELRRKIVSQYGLREGNKIGLISLPPFWEIGKLDYDTSQKEIHFLCESILKSPADYLISLHPRMGLKNYEFINKEYGIPILKEPLKIVLPAGDFFIANYSTTVLWAVICRMPVLVMSYFGWRFDLFNDYPGVTIIENRGELAHALERVSSDDTFFQAMVDEQSKRYREFALWDGKCAKRMVDVFMRIIKVEEEVSHEA